MTEQVRETIEGLKDTLCTIERQWILNPNLELKHIRRGVIDAINCLSDEGSMVSYHFDPANPPARHNEFVMFQIGIGNLQLKAVS